MSSTSEQDNVLPLSKKSGKQAEGDVSSVVRKRPHILLLLIGLILRTATPLAILAAGFMGFVYLKNSKPTVPKKPRAEKVWPVKAQSVAFQDIKPTFRVFGETISGRTVDMRSLVAGKVLKVSANLREGAVVSKGEFLLQIDPFQYRGALIEAQTAIHESNARILEIRAAISSEKDALIRTEEQLRLAEKDYNRAMQLVKRRTITAKTADDRRLVVSQRSQAADQHRNNLVVQEAKLKQQQAGLNRLKWGIERAQRNLKDTELTAPYDAYVTGVGTNIGQVVGANDRVATLLDRNWMEVKFTLSDKQYGRLIKKARLEGQSANILWNVGDKPVVYAASISRVGAKVNAENGGVEVFARLENPHAPVSIREGAFVEVELQDNLYKDVVRIPQSALYGRTIVYVIEKGRLKSREVEVLAVVGEDILVRGELKKGDRLVATKLSFAGDGVRIKEFGGS